MIYRKNDFSLAFESLKIALKLHELINFILEKLEQTSHGLFDIFRPVQTNPFSFPCVITTCLTTLVIRHFLWSRNRGSDYPRLGEI